MVSRRIWLLIPAALLLAPLLIFAGLRLGLATPLVNIAIKKELGGLFNGQVKFGSVKTDLFNFLEINDLLVLTSQGGASIPVLSADRIRLSYDGWRLMRDRKSLEDSVELLSIRTLRVFLLRDSRGRWNLREVLKLPGGQERQKKKKEPGAARAKIPALATRLVLEDSVVVFNDERRDFQSTVENLEGTLDGRAFPLVAFSLSGRTEDKEKDNLSMAGEWNAEESTLFARADLDDVPLKTYLNYALPAGGLQFLDGSASLSLRVRDAEAGSDLDIAGRANVKNGSLAIPGISEPLKNFNGELVFESDRLQVNGIQAAFLGSTWKAHGELWNLRKPVIQLVLENPAVALSPLSEQIKGLKALSLSGTAALSLTLSGQVASPLAEGLLQAPQMGLAGIDVEQVQARLQMDIRGLRVSELRGRLWGGGMQGSAAIAFPSVRAGLPRGSIEGGLNASGVDMGLIRYRGVEYIPLSGTARFESSVKGELLGPRVEASFKSSSAAFGSYPLGGLELKGVNQGKKLDLTLDTWKGRLHAEVNFNFEGGSQFEPSTVRMRNFPLDELMRGIAEAHDTVLITPALKSRMRLQLARYSGTADVEIGLSGPVRSPDLSLRIFSHEGRLKIPSTLFRANDDQGLLFRAAGLLRLGADGLRMGEGNAPFSVSVPGRKGSADFSIRGRLPLKASQETAREGLDIRMLADLRMLEQFALFEKSRGSAELDLRLTGKIDALLASGWLQVKDFHCAMERFVSDLKNGEAQVWIKDRSLTVENLSFDSGGSFEAMGRLDFLDGLRPEGVIEARTDSEKGLYLDNFKYGSIKALLEPLRLVFRGREGVDVTGRAALHDTVVTLSRPTDEEVEARRQAAAQGPQMREPFPVAFNLKAGLQENVWLKKVQGGVEISMDPFVMLKQALNSTVETLQSPGFEFLFKPTERDFVIQGSPPNLLIGGELGIDRGTMTFMENEFKIEQKSRANRVTFRSLERLRADIDAEAAANIRYVRELPGGRLEPRNVRVSVNIKPFTEEELEKAKLENAMLNYNLKEFSSEPPLASSPEENRQAILSLLVLGDPLNQSTRDAIENNQGSSTSLNQLLSIQASRMLSGLLRKTINRYAKSIGNQVVDYVRVAPRLRYQGSSASANNSAVSSNSQSKGLSQQIQQEGFRVSWLVEVGRSLGKNLFASGQLVYFSEDDVNAAKTQTSTQVSKDVRNAGARFVTEYRLAPTRVLEASIGYSVDENLEPMAFQPDKLDQARPIYVGIRNTIPTDNYNPRLARQRYFQAAAKREDAE